MKQYTTSDQTAKLVELGFEKPKSRIDGEIEEILKVIAPLGEFEIPISSNHPAYSIGELIEMLPSYVSIWDTHHPDTMDKQWIVGYLWAQNNVVKSELIDALYEMVVKLKAEGVI